MRDDQKDWDDLLPAIALAFNDAVSESTGYSPAQLLMARDLRMPGIPLNSDRYVEAYDPKDFGDSLKLTLLKAQNLVYERVEKKRKLRAQKEGDTPLTVFKEGDKVWLYVPRAKPGKVHKLTPYWNGPYTVVRRARNDKVYYLKNQFDEELRTAVSLSRLKPYHDRQREMNNKPSFALRDDVSIALNEDNAVTRVTKTHRKSQKNEEPELEKEDLTKDQEIDSPIQPELIFENSSEVEKSTPKAKETVEIVKLPLNRESRRYVGHGGELSSDGKFVILKSRIAVTGKRTRKEIKYSEL